MTEKEMKTAKALLESLKHTEDGGYAQELAKAIERITCQNLGAIDTTAEAIESYIRDAYGREAAKWKRIILCDPIGFEEFEAFYALLLRSLKEAQMNLDNLCVFPKQIEGAREVAFEREVKSWINYLEDGFNRGVDIDVDYIIGPPVSEDNALHRLSQSNPLAREKLREAFRGEIILLADELKRGTFNLQDIAAFRSILRKAIVQFNFSFSDLGLGKGYRIKDIVRVSYAYTAIKLAGYLRKILGDAELQGSILSAILQALKRKIVSFEELGMSASELNWHLERTKELKK